MKKAINQWAFVEGKTVKDCMVLAKHAGFEGIELCFGEDGEINPNSTQEDMQTIFDTANEVGIKISSLASGIFWKYSLISSNKSDNETAKKYIRKMLELGSYLGIDTILVVPGTVGSVVQKEPNVDYDVAYERALEAFKELAGDAEKYKVNIGIENVWNKFLLSPLEMRDFIDKINSKYVGCYFDVGNVLNVGYPQHWIKILGDRIKKVHVKDFSLATGNVNGFVDLLTGDVNFEEVVKSLQAVNYDDYLVAELFPHSYYPERLIYKTSKDMDIILGN
jgi:hexulose-6-phosphate isomerase